MQRARCEHVRACVELLTYTRYCGWQGAVQNNTHRVCLYPGRTLPLFQCRLQVQSNGLRSQEFLSPLTYARPQIDRIWPQNLSTAGGDTVSVIGRQ